MSRLSDQRAVQPEKIAYISNVRVRNESGEAVRFESGETAWVDVEVVAQKDCDKMAVVLYLLDESHYEVFNTSTERLGLGTVSLRAGEKYRTTFQVRVNCANGTFYPSVLLYRYDIQKEFDRLAPAATVYVTADPGVRGAVNCFPRVTSQEVVAPGRVDEVKLAANW
jgi:hypothetical protein